MKKALMIIGGIVVAVVALFIVLFVITSATSDKLKCKSKEGNITLMYNKKTITGYTANNISYDLDVQKKLAEEIGVEEYLEEFTDWFEENTTGTCSK